MSVFAQKENNVWTFGYRAGLDFNTGQPVPIYSKSNNIEGFASVCNRQTGELLFYTDSRYVFDRNHDTMPNGNALNGNSYQTNPNNTVYGSTAQGALIVPLIGDSSKFYLFSLGESNGIASLYYSIVDMTLNNGMGDIIATQKNILLDGSGTLSESMIAIAGEGCRVWLVVHEANAPIFKSYAITETGINNTPVISTHLNNVTTFQISSIAISPNRKKLAMAIYHNANPLLFPNSRGLLLFKFDAVNGTISDEVAIALNSPQSWLNKNFWGVEFSPDGAKLYNHEFELQPPYQYYFSPGEARIVQYNVSDHNQTTIQNSKEILYSYTGGSMAGVFKRMEDKIYCIIERYPYHTKIHRINNPNLTGVASGWELNAISLLLNSESSAAFSNKVVYSEPLNRLLLDTLVCTRNNTELDFVLQAESGHIAYQWDNGDTANSRIIHAPGTYWVRYKTICNWHTDTFIVRHTDINFHLPADTVTCTGYLRFEVNVPDAQYLWQDGSTANQYTATQSGIYWLQVSKQGCAFTDTAKLLIPDVAQNLGSDVIYCNTKGIVLKLSAKVSDGATVQWSTGSTEPEITVHDKGRYWVSVTEAPCTGTDTIVVVEELCACTAFVPTAFSPNGDGLNDMFKPETESGCPVRAYNMQIFNRWGHLIFQNKVGYGLSGWDGTYKGLPADIGVYYYQLHFEAGTHHKAFVQKGEVTLVR